MEGKVVLLTGASEGIGRALAQSLSAQGARLMLVARNRERLEALVAELPGEAMAYPLDLTEFERLPQLVADTLAHFGRLDIALLNAGVTMWSTVAELEDLSVLDRVMRVNYLANAHLAHAVLPALQQSRGQYAVVSSLTGLTGVPTRSGYCASKHAVMGFFEALRVELRGSGVDVTLLCPDFVVTQTHKRAMGADGSPLGQSPMQEGKIMTAEQCAEKMLRAIEGRQRLWLGSWRGRLGRWLKLLAPGVIDRMASRAIARRH
ncbi:SDR family oxidoreductase [Ferrimonas balearica]|uniref:SDR family oxidoreductase n=1 Tax=Ferrimonas balearica TaxID=44012 RepID=UPI001C99E183|nr:SDR family oxidoreductase [Ferrimonas balearica]MBY5992157.1 SDR family oxidoreductase [Ferrimonas balearica]